MGINASDQSIKKLHEVPGGSYIKVVGDGRHFIVTTKENSIIGCITCVNTDNGELMPISKDKIVIVLDAKIIVKGTGC